MLHALLKVQTLPSGGDTKKGVIDSGRKGGEFRNFRYSSAESSKRITRSPADLGEGFQREQLELRQRGCE